VTWFLFYSVASSVPQQYSLAKVHSLEIYCLYGSRSASRFFLAAARVG